MSEYLSNLPRHLRIGLQMGVVVTVVFFIFMAYALRTAPQMSREAEVSLNQFYSLCQQHSYDRAYQLLAPELKDVVTQTDLANRFGEFEKTNGKIERWAPASGGSINMGGRICLIPPFVDYTHRLIGVEPKGIGDATVVYIRMVPRNGQWRLQKLSFMR